MTQRLPFRVGPGEFHTDEARLAEAVRRYHEGKGLIGGDPKRRPHRPPLPPEPAPAFRLFGSSAEHLERLEAFLAAAPLEVEIGSGGGEFILDWAARHPERHFLAFEVKWKAMRRIVERAQRLGLTNLWVSDDDARYDLPRLLWPASVEVFHILFPDPWWKPKHQPRRIFVPPFLDVLAILLKPGGVLRVATDVPGYADYIRDLVENHPDFQTHNPALAARFASAAATARQAFCDEIDRPYAYFYFQKSPTAGLPAPIRMKIACADQRRPKETKIDDGPFGLCWSYGLCWSGRSSRHDPSDQPRTLDAIYKAEIPSPAPPTPMKMTMRRQDEELMNDPSSSIE
ncbi:MAG: hypothetical protein GXP42_16520 [Chloroflexi bacterium]|nr:hypothetical protein [Chloroflexota bacterium]